MQNAKLYLAEALIYLMKEQNIEDIRINDLAKRAGVSRMSYYRYFSSKEQLLHFYMEYILDAYQKTVDAPNKAPFQSYEHILQSLQFFAQYRPFAQCLHKAKMEGLLLETLNDYMRKQPAFQENKAIRSYPYYFYAGALYNTFMQWMLAKEPVPAEELAQIISMLKTSTTNKK